LGWGGLWGNKMFGGSSQGGLEWLYFWFPPGFWAGKTGLRGGEEVVEAGVRRRRNQLLFKGQVMKKISIGSWAYTIGPYADYPVELAHEKAGQ
jgi:hypothetical protein